MPIPEASINKSNRALPASMLVAVLLASAPFSAAAETFVRASIDPDGQLRILTQNLREITPRRDKDQVGFQMAVISPDRHTVGWLAMYPNCCTSYPIPLKLMIYADGKAHDFTGNGLPVWRWRFLSSGKQVAYEQETVHGGLGVHYELRDVATGRLAAEYDPDPEIPGKPPWWVDELDSEK
jgi:hypothetical protein